VILTYRLLTPQIELPIKPEKSLLNSFSSYHLHAVVSRSSSMIQNSPIVGFKVVATGLIGKQGIESLIL
jgi:hypothetical protein